MIRIKKKTDKKQKFKLDFSIVLAADRKKLVDTINLEELTQKELDLCADYILYGKDPDGYSAVEKKEVKMEPKYNSYASKNKVVSLNELMENPAFDENRLSELVCRNKPKKIAPTIDREKLKDIKGMKELWETIDHLQEIIDVNIGKKEDPTGKIPQLTDTQIYNYKHQLIDIRRQQYYLMDSVFPTFQSKRQETHFFQSAAETHLSVNFLPRGLMNKENDLYFAAPRKCIDEIRFDEEIEDRFPTVDFRNTEHLEKLILHYYDLAAMVEKIPDSPIHNLLYTLDFYIQKANLTPKQRLLLEERQKGNKVIDIAETVVKNFGGKLCADYLSTVWKRTLKLISAAVSFNMREQDKKQNDECWKICKGCGRELLIDGFNFTKKNANPDGFNNKCKICEKDMRLKREEKKKKLTVALQ